MDSIIAYCGLVCDSCPIHLASLEQNKSRQKKMRISIARLCSEKYGMNLQPDDINDCDGCRADTGRLFSGCLNCKIRNCASQRNLESCAFCPEYACDNLKEIFRGEPEAQTRLEEIRNTKL
ncbi:MAG: DUF3795 domain-containing protein [Bacteroidales bacterium]|nr:MAG: DUF3795 domain-containing protein [Bacteroidales bacterium]